MTDKREARERAEEALRASEERFRTVADYTYDWEYWQGSQHEIIYMSPSCERITGYANTEFIADPGLIVSIVHPEDQHLVAAHLQDVGNRETAGLEFRIVRRDGEIRWISHGCQAVHGQEGQYRGRRVSNRDITQRKRAEEALLASQRNLTEAQSLAHLGSWQLDLVHNRLSWSEEMYRIFGMPPEEFGAAYETFLDTLHPDDRDTVDRAYRSSLLERNRCDIEYRIVRRSDGQLRWGHSRCEHERDANGKVLRSFGTVQDVTQRKQAEEQLRLAAKVFENSGEAITITDATGRILSVNPAFEAVTGYRAAEVVGQNPRLLKSGRHGAEYYRNMWQSLANHGQWQGEIWNRRKSGEIYPEWLVISAVRDAKGAVINFVAMFSDITERKAAQDRIEFLAFHDPLTRLPNRLLGKDRARQAFAYADRAHSKTAILFLDLDNFKVFNDSLGHSIGDNLLTAVAARLQECIRDTDTLSRLAGDEFLIVLQDVHGNEAISGISEKILVRLAEPFTIEGMQLNTSFSIGIAVYPDDGRDTETLLKHADTAMYRAKEAGRNTYRFFDDQMNVAAVEHLRLREGLRRALEHGEFELYYQPQIELGSGTVVGAEALIRWNHPELGLVPPGRFIPTAEDTGLIVPIGEWALREACRQIRAWRAAGLPALTVAVNLSAVQFKRGNLEHTVAAAIEEFQLDPACLELELTESILIHDTDNVLATVRRLKALGVKLSIDDFGTGYSSLSYLKRFHVDKLKIDQSFVRDLATDPEDEAIVRAVILLAHSLNLRTVAEGVETGVMLEYLRLYECDEAQGYHFARPMPAADFVSHVSRYRPDWN